MSNKGVAIGLGIGCGVVALAVLICVGAFGGLAYFGFNMYKDITGNVDSFLTKIANNDFQGAYQDGSSTLQQKQTLEQFTASAKTLGLTEYQSGAWTQFNIVNETGSISGTMTTKKGGSVALKVDLVKEGGAWKVAGITSPGGIVAPPPDEKK